MVDSTTICIIIACIFLVSVVFFNLFLMVMRAYLLLFALCFTSCFLLIDVPSIQISLPADVPKARCSSLPSWHCSSKFFMLVIMIFLPSFISTYSSYNPLSSANKASVSISVSFSLLFFICPVDFGGNEFPGCQLIPMSTVIPLSFASFLLSLLLASKLLSCER